MSVHQTTFPWREPNSWPPAQCRDCVSGICGGHPVTDKARELALARPFRCDACRWTGKVEDAMRRLGRGPELHMVCPRCKWTGERYA